MRRLDRATRTTWCELIQPRIPRETYDSVRAEPTNASTMNIQNLFLMYAEYNAIVQKHKQLRKDTLSRNLFFESQSNITN